MSDDTHLDGNAAGALLHDLFGREMTEEMGCCAGCGSANVLATVHVYRQAPGDVLRCPVCGAVLVVVVRRGADVRVTFESLRWIEATGGVE